MKEKVLEAKSFLVKNFPIVSRGLYNVPVEFGDTHSSVLLKDGKILIRDEFRDVSSKELSFLILSGVLQHQLAVGKRCKTYDKIIYYLSSAILINEMLYNFFYEKGVGIEVEDIYKKLENFDKYKVVFLDNGLCKDDLLKKKIEDIYAVLYKYLSSAKREIVELYNAYASGKQDAINKAEAEVLDKIYSILSASKNIQRSEKSVSRLCKDIINDLKGAIEKSVLENNKNYIEDVKKITNNVMKDVGAGTEDLSILKELELAKRAKEYSNLTNSIRKFLLESVSNRSKYNYYKISKKGVYYKKKLSVYACVPKYDRESDNKIYVVIDTSGSISDNVYEVFCRIFLDLCRKVEVKTGKIYMFSSRVVYKRDLEKLSYKELYEDLKKRIGYGGTVFTSVLEELKSEKVDKNTYMIVFTDGEFSDSSKIKEYYKMLKMFRKILFITTKRTPKEISSLKNTIILKLDKN